MSVVATTEFDGILGTPKGVKYAYKLFGPPEVSGKMNIQNDPATNLDIVRGVFGVPGSEINVVVMRRDTNNSIIEAARRIGAKLHILESGDFAPSLLSVSSPNKHASIRNGQGIFISYGRGGFEEGTISAAAARALGGHAEEQIWIESPEDKNKPVPNGKILRLDDLVPGEHPLVTFTPITVDPWFGFRATDLDRGVAVGETIQIGKDGFSTHPFEIRLPKAA
jgi:fructose-1,6-bisphosphatase/sedoheptulose 1,7-bisphosphatase-like protein